jgi:nickel-dependent lactate racemase
MADAPALSAASVADALDRPFDALPLGRLAAGCRSAAIVVDDITRPTNSAPLVESLVLRLCQAGMTPSAITVLIATGAHRSALARDVELKVGGVANLVRVVAHDPAGDLVDTGVKLGGVSVRLHRAFMEAGLRIGVGCVMPHPFAAFSGGGKIIVPGIADLDVLARTHKFALMGLQGGNSLAGNTFRTQMECAVREIGLDWTVNVVVNGRRETAFVAAGDVVAAHRAAAEASANVGATMMPAEPLDALLLNAYPKDGELLQIEAALVAVRSGMMNHLAPDAPIVLMAACREGLGSHSLFGPGGRLFRRPAVKSFLNGRSLWFYSPGVDAAAARVVAHESYPFYSEWDRLVNALKRQLRPDARIGVVPCGPLQIAACNS